MRRTMLMSAAAAITLFIATPAVLAADGVMAPDSMDSSSTMAPSGNQDFVNQAAMANEYEVQASQLAVTKSDNKDVVAFASALVKDHTQAKSKLYGIAMEEKLTWPSVETSSSKMDATMPDATGSIAGEDKTARMEDETGVERPYQDSNDEMMRKSMAQLDSAQSAMIDELSKLDGAAFDKAYLEQQATTHSKTVSLLKSYKDSGDNATLKTYAAETLPVVQNHQKMLKAIDARS